MEKTTKDIVEEEVAKIPKDRKKEEAKELVQLVIFELDKEEYAVDISEVREILRMPEITPIPNSPKFIEGIINVRGKIVVVMDMEERFNLKRDTEKESIHILLAEIENSTFGAIVDEVTEVLRIPKDSIELAPSIISEKIHAEYVKGIAVLGDRLIILLDFTKVFEEKGLIELSQLVGKQVKIAQSRRVTEKQEKPEETEVEHKAKVEELLEERMKGAKIQKQKNIESEETKKGKLQEVEK